MTAKAENAPGVESAILTVRGVKVILDADLARLYGVPTKALNQAVKRNAEKFPLDFMFQLTPEEVKAMRSQIATGSPYHVDKRGDMTNWSQNATTSSQPPDNQAEGPAGPQMTSFSRKRRGQTYRSYAFTEHGANRLRPFGYGGQVMAANALNSTQAVQMSMFVAARVSAWSESHRLTPAATWSLV